MAAFAKPMIIGKKNLRDPFEIGKAMIYLMHSLYHHKAKLCLELTGFAARVSAQLGSLKHTQLFLNYQLLPAIQVRR